MNTLRSTWLFLLLALVIAVPAVGQETAAPEAAAAEVDIEATPEANSEAVAQETAPVVNEQPVADEPVTDEPAAEPAVEQETVVEESAEEPAIESAEEADADTVVEETVEEAVEEKADETEAVEAEASETDEDEVVEEDATEEETATDWAGLIERAPVFLSITHHAVIHMPIALWVFGAFFVVVGVVIPSLKNQIPVACLIGGAITSIPAVLSGWWYAEEEWGDDWREFDWASLRENGWSDLELIAQHRWIGVALIAASFLLSIIAIIAYRKQSRLLGFIWRMGLIGLALAVAWEGHIGGELIQGEGFFEEALELWLHPE